MRFRTVEARTVSDSSPYRFLPIGLPHPNLILWGVSDLLIACYAVWFMSLRGLLLSEGTTVMI